MVPRGEPGACGHGTAGCGNREAQFDTIIPVEKDFRARQSEPYGAREYRRSDRPADAGEPEAQVFLTQADRLNRLFKPNPARAVPSRIIPAGSGIGGVTSCKVPPPASCKASPLRKSSDVSEPLRRWLTPSIRTPTGARSHETPDVSKTLSMVVVALVVSP